MDNLEAEQTAEKEHKVPGVPFVKGDPRINYEGRPKGSISPITRVKQIFAEDPERFEQFIGEYIKDPNNRKHIVEMLDGKPFQKTDITSGGDKLQLKVISFDGNTSSAQLHAETIPASTPSSEAEV